MAAKQTKHRVIDWDDTDAAPAASWASGNVFLDWQTGIGGVPKGRVIECYGPESSGKSTLGLTIAAWIWRTFGIPSRYYDFEDAFDARYAMALGLSSQGLLLEQPDALEDFFEAMNEDLDAAIKTPTKNATKKEPGVIALAIFDSVAASRCRDELKANAVVDNRTAGMNRARLWTQWLGTNVKKLSDSNVSLLLVNQLRDYIDTDPGFKPPGMAAMQPKTRTPGGRGIKFYSSLRLAFEPSTDIKVDSINPVTLEPEKAVVGKNVWIKVTKNKVAPPPWRKMRLQIRDGIGFDLVQNLLDFAQVHDIVTRKAGVWTLPGSLFATGEPITIAAEDGWSGDQRMAALLRENADMRNLFVSHVAARLQEIEAQLLTDTREVREAEDEEIEGPDPDTIPVLAGGTSGNAGFGA